LLRVFSQATLNSAAVPDCSMQLMQGYVQVVTTMLLLC
jgi:hypothetical protein